MVKSSPLDSGIYKFSPLGEQLWARYYSREALGVTPGHAGEIFVSDISTNSESILKLSSAGEEIWRAPKISGNIIVEQNGTLVVWGEGRIAKVSDSGTLLWVNTNITASAVAAGPSGAVYVGGYTNYFSPYFTVTKLGPGGDAIWQQVYKESEAVGVSSSGYVSALALNSAEEIFVSGWQQNGTAARAVLLKYDPAGKLLWHSQIHDPGPGFPPTSLVIGSGQKVYQLLPTFMNAGSWEKRELHSMIVKYDEIGTIVGSLTVTNGSWGSAIQVHNSGNVYVARTGLGDFYLDKFAQISAPDEPRILQPLPNQTVLEDSELRIRIEVVPGGEIRYEWLKNGVPIQGADQPELLIPLVKSETAGEYAVRIYYSGGSIQSAPARITVITKPSLAPAREHKSSIINGGAILVVAGGGTLPLEYNWWHNGQKIEGEIEKALRLENLLSPDGGRYLGQASNAGGSVEQPFQLTVFANAEILWERHAASISGNYHQMLGTDLGSNVLVLTETNTGGAHLTKYSPAGTQLWSIEKSRGFSFTTDFEDSVYLASREYEEGRTWTSIDKISTGGVLLWKLTNNSPLTDWMRMVGTNLYTKSEEMDQRRFRTYDLGGKEVGTFALSNSVTGYISKIEVDPNRYLLIYGSVEDYVTLSKYSIDGTQVWKRSFNSPVRSLVGGQVLGVGKDGSAYIIVRANSQYFLLRISSSGVTEWERLLPGSVGTHVLILDPDENILVANGNLIRKFSSSGDRIWEAELFERQNGCCPEALIADSNGDIYVGSAESLVKIGAAGLIHWKMDDFGTHHLASAGSLLYVAGAYDRKPGFENKILAIKNGEVPPTLPARLKNHYFNLGQAATIGLEIENPAQFTYHWIHNGRNLWNETNSVLEIESFGAENTGLYSVVISDSSGARAASTALISLTESLNLRASRTVAEGKGYLVISLNSKIGQSYSLETSVDLVSWAPVETFTAVTQQTSRTIPLAGDAILFLRVVPPAN